MAKLVIDDRRILNLTGEVIYARTVDRAVKLLNIGKYEEVWFDHDMGPDQDIWEVIAFLEQRKHFGLPVKIGKVMIHTSNPVGAQRLKLALDKMKYRTQITSANPYLGGIIE